MGFVVLILLVAVVPSTFGAVSGETRSDGSYQQGQHYGISGTHPTHMAEMRLPSEGGSEYSSAPYDEQLGLTLTRNFTSLSYNVTAVEQTDSESDTGPAYLLNGLSNNGSWYQVGLSWNWAPGFGFGMVYEVFNRTGASIFPTNGGGGLSSFSGSVNEGDSVLLKLTFSGGNVTMVAADQSTGASASESYNAERSTYFIGSSSEPANSQGFFTGLMTEWYHASSYSGSGAQVVYSQSVALTSGWMWMDEFDTITNESVFVACANSCSSPTSYSNPTQLQSLLSNGVTESSDAFDFVTGPLTPAISSVSCSRPLIVVGTSTTCKVRLSSATVSGIVAWSSNGTGTFSAASCRLSRGACQLRYTPTSSGSLLITASYQREPWELLTTGTFALTVTSKTTKTTVSCSPTSVPANSSKIITCKAKVTGYSPTGNVTWTQTGIGSVSFITKTCALFQGACSVTMTGVRPGSVAVQASYGGNSNNVASSGTRGLKIGKASTAVTIACSATTLIKGVPVTCTATVSGYPPTGTVTWSKVSGTGRVAFSSKTCTLSSGSCQVTITATVAGSIKIKAAYGGDSNNLKSSGTVVLA